jgi:pSer/pThr/pTyr-binding forkhead associated (FHA) protein
MGTERNGELIPVGGGDNIPLIRNKLTIGRRESCDICLRFPNISGIHCELTFQDGYWLVADRDSKNGVKVNDHKIKKKALRDGDIIAIASRLYTIKYTMRAGQHALEEILEDDDDIMSQPLLEKAGLVRPRSEEPRRAPAASPRGGNPPASGRHE